MIRGLEITHMIVDELATLNSSFTDNEVKRIQTLKSLIKKQAEHKLSQLPSELSSAITAHCILTGGVTASIAHWEDPNDLDFYVVKPVMLLKIESLIKKHIDLVADVNPKYIEKFVDGKCITGNAVTFTNGVQVITRGTFDEMHKVFDYIHCQPYYDFAFDKFFISRKQFHAIMQKKLIKNPNGVSEVDREQKFKERGWKP
jgi:hypothetical protein